MLQLKNITKSYTTGDFTQTALDGVSINFRKSEFVAILGHSGSGKTTCLNVVGGLDQYDSGDLIINGKSTKDFKDSEWDAYRNNSVGFVFQSYNLIPHLSVVDNVEMGMTLSGVSVSEKHKRAVEVLTRVGLKDHIHKKPNQLSGGQMQRVAIARALANDPDVILADEPTGALDSQTSVQIMELIREIAKDKLVVMVTHNPELANNYADRIISFQDGRVVADSNPPDDKTFKADYALKKTSMSFLTALKLSGKNIATKKGRTALTAFASSIGIIGIALILSLSNGFDKQIKNFESTTLSGFPILITQSAAVMDEEQMREQGGMFGDVNSENRFPDVSVIYPYDASASSIEHFNNFTEEYIDYIDQIDPALLSGVSYTRMVNTNILKSDGSTATAVNPTSIGFTAYPENVDPNKVGYLESGYDLLAGTYPQEMTDLVMIVDNFNRLDITILEALGLDPEVESISFDDIIGHELRVILNDDFYTQAGDYFVINGNPTNLIDMYNNERAIPIRITGIVRASEDNALPILMPGIAYSGQLVEYFIEDAQQSEIVIAQQDASYNVLTGEAFIASPAPGSGMMPPGMASGPSTKESVLSMLGADGTPYMITLYPTDFNTKEQITEYLSAWNEGKEREDRIIYMDLAAEFTNLSGSIMNAITLVLVAFASISLVVSVIMIAIITYISVLERIKEIGVLRALGARKKDITRVFNAETFIIGVFSGALGIAIAYVLIVPVNIILENATDLANVAQLNPLHALVLITISVALTMLGGAIPAKMAAKKDPVDALRAE